MKITVTVRDQSSTGRQAGVCELEDIPSAITVRELIRTRVREEVARYNAGPSNIFAGLVMPEGAEPARGGFALPTRRRVDWRNQADRAVSAFSTNAFFVLIDDRQATELDEELDLTPDSDICFVRLVQLVGG